LNFFFGGVQFSDGIAIDNVIDLGGKDSGERRSSKP
jgi:hypothetical protein